MRSIHSLFRRRQLLLLSAPFYSSWWTMAPSSISGASTILDANDNDDVFLQSLKYEKILGTGAYKHVYLVSSQTQTFALAVSRLRVKTTLRMKFVVFRWRNDCIKYFRTRTASTWKKCAIGGFKMSTSPSISLEKVSLKHPSNEPNECLPNFWEPNISLPSQANVYSRFENIHPHDSHHV